MMTRSTNISKGGNYLHTGRLCLVYDKSCQNVKLQITGEVFSGKEEINKHCKCKPKLQRFITTSSKVYCETSPIILHLLDSYKAGQYNLK